MCLASNYASTPCSRGPSTCAATKRPKSCQSLYGHRLTCSEAYLQRGHPSQTSAVQYAPEDLSISCEIYSFTCSGGWWWCMGILAWQYHSNCLLDSVGGGAWGRLRSLVSLRVRAVHRFRGNVHLTWALYSRGFVTRGGLSKLTMPTSGGLTH